MKRKILLFGLTMLFALFLVACGNTKPPHDIKIEEVSSDVQWTTFEYVFKVVGEDDTYKIATGSLEGTLYDNDGKKVLSRTATSVSNSDNKKFNFTGLKYGTDYELIITASISQKKYELFKVSIKTLIDGGSIDDPIIINTVEDWNNITTLNAYYKLGADIDFNGEAIKEVFRNGLKGGFDGDGHKLTNFTIGYKNFYGIFGNMSSGSGFIQNLVIDNITIDNHEFAETKETTDSYFGLLAKTLAVSTKVSNVTFTNIDVNLITTRLYGIRYFGLIAPNHGGLIEDIKLTNTNVTITHDNYEEVIIGGLVGKLVDGGKINRVNYESGNFNIISSEYTYTGKSVKPSYFGTIAGEGFGHLTDIVSKANVNLEDLNAVKDGHTLTIEGDNVEVKAPSLGEDFVKTNFTFVKEENVEIKFIPKSGEKIKEVYVDGETLDLDDLDDFPGTQGAKTLTLENVTKNTHVVVYYKVEDDTTTKLTVSGTNFNIITDEEETPTEWAFGAEITIKPNEISGDIQGVKINGIFHPVVDGVVKFNIERNTTIVVLSRARQSIFVGGVVGATTTLKDIAYSGTITLNKQVPFQYPERFVVGGIAADLYKSADNIFLYNAEIKLESNDLQNVVLTGKRLITNPGSLKVDGFVINSNLTINDELIVEQIPVKTELTSEDVSEFVYNLLK